MQIKCRPGLSHNSMPNVTPKRLILNKTFVVVFFFLFFFFFFEKKKKKKKTEDNIYLYKFLKLFLSCYIILKIQKLENKQCRPRLERSLQALSTGPRSTLISNSSSFLSIYTDGRLMTRFYVLFNSILVISGRYEDDNERLCALETRLR